MADFCIIGDELIVTGIRLAGLKSCYSANEKNVKEVLGRACEKFAMIAITYSLARIVKEEIKKFRKEGRIIVEIPDRRGGGEDTIREIVKEVIGFELKK